MDHHDAILQAATSLFHTSVQNAGWGFAIAAGCLVTFRFLIPMLARILAFRRMMRALRG